MQRLFLTISLLFVGALSQSTALGRPNVIVVMTDDQGYGDLSCHGNPIIETPNLDRLAERSIRFTDFHVAPMCTPTRGQLLTGIDALRNGAMNVSSGRSLLRREFPTMADIFAAAGYETGIFGKWHLGDNYPYRPQDRGFATSLWFPSSHINSVPDYWENDYFDDIYFAHGRRERVSGYCTDVFMAKAIQWMKKCSENQKPFFAYIPLNAPHGPFFVPDKFREPIEKALASSPQLVAHLQPRQKADLISFLAMIENIDENIDRLESFLEHSGLRDDTILIFLTDNGSVRGPRYFNAGMRGGKMSLYEGGHRVPCFIRWPNGDLREPEDIAELVHVQDLLPSLIEFCDLRPPDGSGFDGVSLASLLRGDMDALDDRMLVVHYSRMPSRALRSSRDSPAIPQRDGAAVLWKRWRLLRENQLYDLETDPMQQQNVIRKYPHVAAKMQQYLDAWWQRVENSVNTPERIIIGTEHENPTMLTACEWYNVFVDQQTQVRQGVRKNGVWYLEVAKNGDYEIELYRWPPESNLMLTERIPSTTVVDGLLPAGVALPIAAAQLKIGDATYLQQAADKSTAIRFRVSLQAGPTTLQATFLDAQAKQICGAYYVLARTAKADRRRASGAKTRSPRTPDDA